MECTILLRLDAVFESKLNNKWPEERGITNAILMETVLLWVFMLVSDLDGISSGAVTKKNERKTNTSFDLKL